MQPKWYIVPRELKSVNAMLTQVYGSLGHYAKGIDSEGKREPWQRCEEGGDMNRGMLCGHTEPANLEEGLEAGRQGRWALQLGNGVYSKGGAQTIESPST